MYKVLVSFSDSQDGNFVYQCGDTYPRDGVKPTAERIEMLTTSKNAFNRPLIEKVKEDKKEVVKEEDKKPTKKSRKK